jgi:hypothetical protein
MNIIFPLFAGGVLIHRKDRLRKQINRVHVAPQRRAIAGLGAASLDAGTRKVQSYVNCESPPMPVDDLQNQERQKTIDELSKLIVGVQEMARRLADKTHGTTYDKVLALNELLHQARLEIEQIQTNSTKY